MTVGVMHVSEQPEIDPEQARGLCDRMREASKPDTVAGVARRLWFSRETTRRYFKNGRPSLNFIIAFCQAYNVTPNWLIYGVGPKRWEGLGLDGPVELPTVTINRSRQGDESETPQRTSA